MSYRGLGQEKYVPGQVGFLTSRRGRVPRIQRMVEAGVAPYIEHGSYITGAPDIVRFGYDPYRGIMGCSGLGQSTITDFMCSQTAASKSWRERLDEGLSSGAQAAMLGAAAAGLLGALLKRPIFAVAVGAGVGFAAHVVWTAPVAAS